jgi:hypothetical protein
VADEYHRYGKNLVVLGIATWKRVALRDKLINKVSKGVIKQIFIAHPVIRFLSFLNSFFSIQNKKTASTTPKIKMTKAKIGI